MSGFSSHPKIVQENLLAIISNSIPKISKNFVFISDEYLYNKLIEKKISQETSKLYITRGLHFGDLNDALHFNIKIIGYDTEFHVYVGLDYNVGHYPFMLLFITDGYYTIPKLYNYLQDLDYIQYLLFNIFDPIFTINDIINYYTKLIKENQKLFIKSEKEEKKS